MPKNEKLMAEQIKAGGMIAGTAFISDKADAEIPISLSDRVTVYGNTRVGKFTYINVGTVVYTQTFIGRFCSIGRDCHLGMASHPLHFLSTHPFQFTASQFIKHPGFDKVQNAVWPGQSGEAYKVLSQDRHHAVGYVCPSICTFVGE